MTPYEYGRQTAIKLALATPGPFRNYYAPKQLSVPMVADKDLGDVDINQTKKLPSNVDPFSVMDAKTNWLADTADMSP